MDIQFLNKLREKSLILKEKSLRHSPKGFLRHAINNSLKELERPESEAKKEIKKLFDEGGSWGRGLIINIADVDEYHFDCNGNTEFYWLKDKPLVPFPRPGKDAEERAKIQKSGRYANCEIILPYEVFLLILGKELGPRDAHNKGLATIFDYDGLGSLYHGSLLMKFFENLRSSVGL